MFDRFDPGDRDDDLRDDYGVTTRDGTTNRATATKTGGTEIVTGSAIDRREADNCKGVASGLPSAPAATATGFLENWRRERDSNPRNRCRFSGFQDHRHRPLGHPSAWPFYSGIRTLVSPPPLFPSARVFLGVSLQMRPAGRAPIVEVSLSGIVGLLWRTGRASTCEDPAEDSGDSANDS